MGLFNLKEKAEKSITEQVQRKVGELVATRFGSDYRKAFDHYDRLTTQNGTIDSAALLQLLKDAGVESMLASQQDIAAAIMKKFDTSGDQQISWEEFAVVFESPTR